MLSTQQTFTEREFGESKKIGVMEVARLPMLSTLVSAQLRSLAAEATVSNFELAAKHVP